MPDLLIELFSEEIPARMQPRAREGLRRLVTDGLVEAGLTYAHAAAFSTPRRLTLAVEGLSPESPTLREEKKGPRADAPAQAIEGFLRSTGLTREQLEARDAGKGEILFAVIERPGRPAPEIVAEVLGRTIRDFPWPKSMRWGAGSLRWVRPLHAILCLLTDEAGAEVVPFEIDGLKASDTTEGHRFMSPGRLKVASFEDYAAKLKRAHVILDSAEREARIQHEAEHLAFAAGLELVPDRALLTEVAGLVEWPVVLMGEIGKDFLTLPPEVLQTSMREHQKFFSLRDPATNRIERFITVANRETADHGATILQGNAKVLTARLSDARFFWENDLRTVRTEGMEGMAKGLEQVTFHHALGSQADRVKRIEALAREIAPLVGAKPDLAAEAARICKADLQSEMVGEFPELQGLMGRYYAEAAGHDYGVPEACEMHYKPLGPSDAVPVAPISVAVALADKIDTLTGFWAIDEKPTGSKDPFALRRAALGVIRLVLANGLRIELSRPTTRQVGRVVLERYYSGQAGAIENLDASLPSDIAEEARLRIEGRTKALDLNEMEDVVVAFPSIPDVASDLLAFFHDRLKVHLKDEGIRHDVIDAVLAMPGSDDLTLVVKRAEALADFLKTDDGENLILGFKRANNILIQAEEKDGVEYSFGADPKFAEDPTEIALFDALDRAETEIAPAMEAEDFGSAMAAMARLRKPIDAFFDTVQVNTENQMIRRNRLNMLHRIRAICLSVADLTKLEG
jgi:glycyl-tRNA synthetase beta chain